LNRTVDGQLQTFAAKDGAFNRQHFFGQTPGTRAMAPRSPMRKSTACAWRP
jgi:pyruvate dehydrogenase complex dehydrogenase (E1) component